MRLIRVRLYFLFLRVMTHINQNRILWTDFEFRLFIFQCC